MSARTELSAAADKTLVRLVDVANLLNDHHGETEALRRALRFFTEILTLGEGCSVDCVWERYMMAPLEWSGRPAVHAVVEILTNAYLDRVEAVHQEAERLVSLEGGE